ncbi:hypothetical protein NB705_003885 [Xanthomonas sacchari]|nr:hypothetical protein [Xanthomonas sacchari]
MAGGQRRLHRQPGQRRRLPGAPAAAGERRPAAPRRPLLRPAADPEQEQPAGPAALHRRSAQGDQAAHGRGQCQPGTGAVQPRHPADHRSQRPAPARGAGVPAAVARRARPSADRRSCVGRGAVRHAARAGAAARCAGAGAAALARAGAGRAPACGVRRRGTGCGQPRAGGDLPQRRRQVRRPAAEAGHHLPGRGAALPARRRRRRTAALCRSGAGRGLRQGR